MSVELSREIWTELRRYVNPQDRTEAADTVVSVLIDNDVSANEIREAFKGDAEIKRALTHYIKDHEEEIDEDDSDQDDNDENEYED